MQMLHCISQVPMEGGENQLSDGFHAALKLKESNPDYYELLSTAVVDFHDVGVEDFEFYQMNRIPIISWVYFDISFKLLLPNKNASSWYT